MANKLRPDLNYFEKKTKGLCMKILFSTLVKQLFTVSVKV